MCQTYCTVEPWHWPQGGKDCVCVCQRKWADAHAGNNQPLGGSIFRVSLQSGIFIGMNRLYYTLKEVFLIHCSIVSATLNNSYVVFKSGSGTQLKTVIVVYVQL